MSRLLCLLATAGAMLLMTGMVSAQDENLISYDQIVSGEITNDSPEIRYQFQGSQNENILISMTSAIRATDSQGETPLLDSFLQLLNPEGVSLLSDDDTGGNLNALLGPITLAESGTYTVVATRLGGSEGRSTGTFELVIKHVQIAPLVADETVSAEIPSGVPSATYFSVDGGTDTVFRLVAKRDTGGVPFSVLVRDSEAGYVGHVFSSAQGEVVMEAFYPAKSGTYLITLQRENQYDNRGALIANDSPLTVGVTLQSVETQPMQLGETITGILDDQSPAVYYAFAASEGQLVRLEGAQSAPDSQPFGMVMVAPDGRMEIGASTDMLDDQGRFVIDPLRLTMSGEYVFAVHRIISANDDGMATTDYTIILDNTQSPSLINGTEAFDRIEAPINERVYLYEGTEEQSIRITLRSLTEGYHPVLNIEGPPTPADGDNPYPGTFSINTYSTVTATITFELALPESGIYYFRIYNGNHVEGTPVDGEFGLLIEALD